MSRREMLLRGLVLIDPAGTPVAAELWSSGTTAVAFERTTNAILGTLHNVVRSVTDDGRLVLTGDEGVWTAQDPERALGAWVGVKVAWPGEDPWEAATVQWSNYRVTVQKIGQTARVLVGAQIEVSGSQQWIVMGDEWIEVDGGRRGCRSCGGG